MKACVDWRSIAQQCHHLAPLSGVHVIIGEPSAQAGTQFRSGLEGVQIDAFVLHRSREPFDEDIVHAASPSVHADLDFGCAQHTGEGIAGELAALIGVEDLGLAETGQRIFQGLNAKARVHGVR